MFQNLIILLILTSSCCVNSLVLNSTLLDSHGFNKSSVFIRLDNQNITDIDLSTFEGYTNLLELDLSANLLRSVDLEVFKYAVKLSFLVLSENPLLSELTNKKSLKLSSLQQLTINGCQLSELDANVINGLSNLKYLDIQNGFEESRLRPIIANELSKLSELRSLTLSTRDQESLNSQLFNGLDSLDTLYFVSSGIKQIASNTFSRLKNLTYIDLKNNSLTSLTDFELPERIIYLGLEFNQLNSLTFSSNSGAGNLLKLDLSYNQFKSFRSINFGRLTNLTSLFLTSNPIDDQNELIDDLRPLRNLFNLYLVGLGINSLNSSFFQNNTKLHTIDLGFNNMSRFPTESFKNLNELLMIIFQANQLEELDNQTFAGLSQLVTINLSMNQISKIAPQTFSSLKNVESIYLRRNRLSEIDAATFAGLDKIIEIDLAYNKLTKIAPGTFANLTSLRYIFLDRNQLTSLDSSTFHGCNSLIAIYLFNNTNLDTTNMASLCPTFQCHVYY